MECVFYSMSSAWKVQIILILHHVKVSQDLLHAQHPLPLASSPFPAILQVMWHLDPLWLDHWPSFRGRSSFAELKQKLGGSTNRSEFCHLWGIDKLIFWSHYVLKQLIGRLLLYGICHIIVNCLRNADCWKVSPLSGTWCELLFCKHRCQSHGG